MFGFTDIRKETDEQLMRLIAKGKKKAFEVLYDRYHGRLVSFALKYTADREQAKDMVQDVFMKLIESPHQFDGGRRFLPWVYTLTANRCKNALRNEQNRSRILQEAGLADEATPVQRLPRHDREVLQEQIRAVLLTLNDKERLVYALRFEQDMSVKDIAAAAEIPEGSVKSCIYYMLKKFERQLKTFEHE